MSRRLEAWMAATCLALAPASPSLAQSYPARPIHLIVAFAPGGPVDVVARVAAERLPEILGAPVVVENRPSSTGNLATQVVAKAPPDGYMILATSSAFAVNVSLSPNAGYEPRDFAPIIQAATQPNVIVVNSEFPAQTLAELLDRAKTMNLAYASPGAGTTPHLTGEHLFRAIAKLDVVHIPYKGAGPAAAAVAAGEPPIGSLAVTAPLPFIRSGRLRALAISSATRLPLLPDVPTFAELGYPEIEDYTWVGFFAPAGTAPEVVQKLNAAFNRVLQMPEVRDRLEALTFEPIGGSAQQFAEYVRAEVAKWAVVVKQTGAKLD
ncbi:MAG TPA: tripartite tricarboxylate transporter substrate binding protein [Casimicrobiaceae bacterium]|jgi:tripartite-type tricarboxylate transporter receptor subunit TctC|nr:tripartite tricarboxylate transporter substrate binding protein [Casimicrobiaceae bacterium]